MLLFSNFEKRQFQTTREQVCEEFHVLYKTWTLPYYLSALKVFGDTRSWDETNRKVCALIFFTIMKKFLSLIILSIFCMNKINADTTWNLSGDGTLTISGTGEVSYNNQCPKADIKTLVIGNGVTSIASYTFKDCNALTSITFGNSIESILVIKSLMYNSII